MKLMPTNFELELNGVKLQIFELAIPKLSAFRVTFSSLRQPIIVARTTDAKGDVYWTSVPEGRQKEAEGVGKLIEAHFKKLEEK